jgi:hypothetical protein
MLDMFGCYANSAGWIYCLYSLAGNPDSLLVMLTGRLAGLLDDITANLAAWL